jgi:branched-chain amino acid transport system substrate-binding protein
VVFFIFPVNRGKPDSSKKEVVMSGIHCRVFFSLLLVVLTACPALGAPPIKIGALFSITGPASFLGEPERNTAQMVVDEINKAGGIGGRTLELVTYDTQGDATKAVQAATRLIKEDKVVAIIGPSTTGDTMAVIPLVEKAQIPLVSCAAGIKITEPVKKWVFKTAQNDSLAVARIYEQLKKQKISKIAVLTVSDSFGSSGREQLTAQAKSYGIQIITDETYGPKDTDMTAQLTKIRGTQAQAIVCWGTNPGPAIIARNVKQLGLNIPLYMSHGVSSKKFIDLAGDAADGIILPSGRVLVANLLPNSDPQKKNLQKFVKDYQLRYKAEGDHFGGHAWDAVMLLKGAIERGGDSPAGIRDQLEQTRNFSGIGGIYNYSVQDHAGLTKDAFVLVEVKNKGWALVK